MTKFVLTFVQREMTLRKIKERIDFTLNWGTYDVFYVRQSEFFSF